MRRFQDAGDMTKALTEAAPLVRNRVGTHRCRRPLLGASRREAAGDGDSHDGTTEGFLGLMTINHGDFQGL